MQVLSGRHQYTMYMQTSSLASQVLSFSSSQMHHRLAVAEQPLIFYKPSFSSKLAVYNDGNQVQIIFSRTNCTILTSTIIIIIYEISGFVNILELPDIAHYSKGQEPITPRSILSIINYIIRYVNTDILGRQPKLTHFLLLGKITCCSSSNSLMFKLSCLGSVPCSFICVHLGAGG